MTVPPVEAPAATDSASLPPSAPNAVPDDHASRVPKCSAKLDVGESFYRDLLNEVEDGIYFVDPKRRITFWNKGAERITGYSAAEVVGISCADKILMHVDAAGNCLCNAACPLKATIEDGNRRSAHVFLHHKDGHRVPVRIQAAPLFSRYGRLLGGIETFYDTSGRQVDVERMRKLASLAFMDDLTGLPNRRYLDSTLKNRFADLKHNGWDFGLIMLDVDHFKRFNDEHGHDTGDKILQVVATTISKACRNFDSVGRWGGEEFLVIVGNADAECLSEIGRAHV